MHPQLLLNEVLALPEHILQLKTISRDLKNTEAVLLSQDKTPKVFGNIKAMHWRDVLTTLLTK